MAENENVNPITLTEAADQLRELLVKVYKAKIFVRAGKELAEELFKCATEAGAMMAAISNLTEKSIKVTIANQAIVKLTHTSYLLKTMNQAGLYRYTDINDLLEYVELITLGLKDLLLKEGAKRANQSAATQPVVLHTAPQLREDELEDEEEDEDEEEPTSQPIFKFNTVHHSDEDEAENETATTEDDDDEGFNDYVDVPDDNN